MISTTWSGLANLMRNLFRSGQTSAKKESKSDLRDDMVKVAVPDEHEHLADGPAAPSEGGPQLVAPGFDIQAPGEVAKG